MNVSRFRRLFQIVSATLILGGASLLVFTLGFSAGEGVPQATEVPPIQGWKAEEYSILTPSSAAVQTEAPEPSSTPTPIAEPPKPWEFTSAQLVISDIGINAPVYPYDVSQLVETTTLGPNGYETYLAVNPPDAESVAWYTGIPGGIPSDQATRTGYFFGHTRPGESIAVFNNLGSVQLGSILQFITPDETLIYKAVDIREIYKTELTMLKEDPIYGIDHPGRIVLATCYRPEEWNAEDFDGNGTRKNIVVAFDLVRAE